MIRKLIKLSHILRDSIFSDELNKVSVSNQNTFIPKLLFSLTICLYITYQILIQSSWLFSGEMWAEMATNYFVNAKSSSYLTNFFATDAGYIPLPPRIIAFIGNSLNMSAAVIPYFYTWSGIVLTGMMIGSFCLPQFSVVIKSNELRFLTALTILIVNDFDVKTFINFTYFASFFIAIITALSLVDKSKEVPWWSWFIPILIISKPAVLATLPAMIIVAIVSKNRFRLITLISVSLCLLQISQMIISHKSGLFIPSNEEGILLKILTSFKYFFGLLGKYFFGRSLDINKYCAIALGIILVIIAVFLSKEKKCNSIALVLIGLSLLFFNVLLNSFTLSDHWNSDISQLGGIPFYRHIIVGFFGSVLFVCGISDMLSKLDICKSFPKFLQKNFAAFLFLIWFDAGLWLKYSKSQTLPLSLINSQWQNMSSLIDQEDLPICVPVAPINFVYSRNCSLLTEIPSWNGIAKLEKEQLFLDVKIPTDLTNKTIISAAILVKPLSSQEEVLVNAQLVIKLNNEPVANPPTKLI